MSHTENDIQRMIDYGYSLYNDPDRTRDDLLQCEDIFREALELRIEAEGPETANVAYLHNALGMVYGKLDDRFVLGETHFSAAARIYTDPSHLAIVQSNHADLLVAKGKLIMDEAEDAREDLMKATPATKDSERPLAFLINKDKRERERLQAAGIEEVRVLRRLAVTNEEAMNCFRRAEILRARAYTNLNKALKKAKEKENEGMAAKMSASRALVVAGKKGIAAVGYQSPAQILSQLDKVAIGQQAAKRGLATGASQHLHRMLMTPEQRAETDKSNILVLGPTGCGKTLLVAELCRIMGLPFYRTDASKLTAAGYVGEDVQSILEGLLRACNYDMELAQNGVVYVDEIDKIAGHNMGGQKDVGGEAVQQELLTILEGARVMVRGKSGKRDDQVEIDTTNILFIAGGAFVGLGDIVARRTQATGTSIGFGATVKSRDEDKTKYQRRAKAEDFIAAGMIPEFIGRMPHRLFLDALTVDQLERILVEPKKALTVQKRLLLSRTTDLRFTKGALREIAEAAHKAGTNGRGLSEIMQLVLEPIIFAEPKLAIITAEMVRNREQEVAACNEAEEVLPPLPDFVIDDDQVEAVQNEASRAPGRALTVRRAGTEVAVR